MSQNGQNSSSREHGPSAIKLRRGKVHIWRADLSSNREALSALERTLAPGERQRADQFRFHTDRNRYILAHGLLRSLVAAYLNIPPGEPVFRSGPQGKPELANESLRFNLSHSHELVVCAIGRAGDVGIDVELVRPGVEEDFTRRLSPEALLWLGALPKPVRRRAFFQAWTRMEAYWKARGQGLDRSTASSGSCARSPACATAGSTRGSSRGCCRSMILRHAEVMLARSRPRNGRAASDFGSGELTDDDHVHAGAQSDAGSPDARRNLHHGAARGKATATPDAVGEVYRRDARPTVSWRAGPPGWLRTSLPRRGLGRFGRALSASVSGHGGWNARNSEGRGRLRSMDPAYPADRLAFMLERPGAGAGRAIGAWSERLPAFRSELVDIADPQLARLAGAPHSTSLPRDLATSSIRRAPRDSRKAWRSATVA